MRPDKHYGNFEKNKRDREEKALLSMTAHHWYSDT